jgi:4-amino-4-deoxy-L-arabinose transferase-like glycosyltransferase
MPRNDEVHPTGESLMTVEPTNKKAWRFLVLAALFIAFFFQGSRALWEPDEGFYATVAGNMVKSGDYVVPHLNGGIFLEKPPVVYWMMAAGLKVFGWNEWGLRFFHALALVLSTLLVALLGSSLWGSSVGLRAGLFYLLSIAPFAASNILTPDMPLALFVASGMFCFWKGWKEDGDIWKIGFLLSFAAAWMTKSTASIVWASAPVMFLFLSGSVKRFLKSWWLLSVLPIAVLALVWYVVVGQEVPGSLEYFWKNHVTGRMVTSYYQRNPGWRFVWYYIPVLIAGALPFSFILFKWGREFLGKARSQSFWKMDKEYLFILCWVLFPMLVLTAAQSRLVLYALPVFGALALVAARWWEPSSIRAKRMLWVWGVFLLCLKAGMAFYPYAQDDRAVWRVLKTQCPSGQGAVVLMDGGLNGVGFYADLPVKNALWRGGYLYFDPPPMMKDLAQSMKAGQDWTLWVTDGDKVEDLAAQLKPFGLVKGIFSLPGRHASVLLRYRP